MAKVDANKALNDGKDGYQKGGIKIETPSQNLEIDPRSKLDNWNLIPTGDKVEVKGTKRMLKSKSKTATWF